MLWRNVSIKTKLIASFAGLLAAFIAVSVFNLIQFNSIQMQLHDENQKKNLQLLALQTKEMVQDLNVISNGLMISKNLEYVQKYNEKKPQFHRMIQTISATAVTREQQKWRSRLVSAAGDYINTFETAAQIIGNPNLSAVDKEKNMKYYYDESQRWKEMIFTEVDAFYRTYSAEAQQAAVQSQKQLDAAGTVMLLTSAIVAAAAAMAAFWIIRSLVHPMRRLQNAVRLIAEGDLRHKINDSAADEFGRLSRHFDEMTDKMAGMLKNAHHIASSLSDHARAFQEFSQDTAQSNNDIVKAIREISAGADHQAMQLERCAGLSAELEARMNEISSHASSMKRTSEEATRNARIGEDSVKMLQESATRCDSVLGKADEAIDVLAEKSMRMEKIVQAISEISTQTNVLSLNAAIESARAGAHGKSFAVISEQISKLSAEVNESAQHIAQMIQPFLRQLAEVRQQMALTRESMREQSLNVEDTLQSFAAIHRSIGQISGQIGQIYTKTEEAKEKNRAFIESVQYVAAVAQQTAAGGQQVHAASARQNDAIGQIAGQAADINVLSKQLFAEISKFRLASGHESAV